MQKPQKITEKKKKLQNLNPHEPTNQGRPCVLQSVPGPPSTHTHLPGETVLGVPRTAGSAFSSPQRERFPGH